MELWKVLQNRKTDFESIIESDGLPINRFWISNRFPSHTSYEVFFHEIKCYGMTSFMEFMKRVRALDQLLGFSPSMQVTWVWLPGLTTSRSSWSLKIIVAEAWDILLIVLVIDQNNECSQALWHHSIVRGLFREKHEDLMRFGLAILNIRLPVSLTMRKQGNMSPNYHS